MATPSRSSRNTGLPGSSWLLALLLAACSSGGKDDTGPDGGTPTDGGMVSDGGTDTTTDGGTVAERWAGTANVAVVNPDGQPVAGAWVMLGGADQDSWVQTDAAGLATLEVTDDGITDRQILAGMEGWISGGTNIRETEPPDDPVVVELTPLPDADNPDYAWQPGGDSSSMHTSECGHCHYTIADGWAGSLHRDAGRNSTTWDLYRGSAQASDEAACQDLGGWLAEGAVPGGDGSTETVCYVEGGLLPLLNDCGGEGQDGCDHPDERAGLSAFGSCGDCHSPAVDGGVPGQIDLASTTGIAFDEGVACDFCHKIRAVTPGGAPGLDGAITLERPSQPTMVTGQEYDPITFGPYPDVIVAIMKGSYAPQFREAEWCSSCHEYSRGALSDDLPVDGERWPEGLPIHETWSELVASPYGSLGTSCQGCHMPVIDEESSTYDISPLGVNPSVDQGWLRELGEVRHHHFPASGELDPPDLDVDADWDGDGVSLEVEVFNGSAAHAVPTGEPLRQLVVLVEAVDEDGLPVTAIEGPTVPDVGGYRAMAVAGADLVASGSSLRFVGQALSGGAVAVRVVRPTGEFMDDAGPGTGWFDGLSAEDKGLPVYTAVGSYAVTGLSGDTVTVEGSPSVAAGDVAYLVGEGDLAGAPGWLYSKTLVDGDGARGVAHYRAVDVASDNRIGVGVTAATSYRAAVPGGSVTVRLVRRRYAAPVAGRHGWDPGDLELAVVERVDETEVDPEKR